ncbi:MAG: peptidoglycan DD-metalloendopeptidase family protein [Gammaproteobacteria bacterium]|nr:peptidoglycan DD-metalloendopeptidase family protein [Gammaproteobacteria bacterium]
MSTRPVDSIACQILQLWCIWAAAAWAQADAVPGGLYIYSPSQQLTGAKYRDRPVLIIDGRALVGIPLSAQPGTHVLAITSSAGGIINHEFSVLAKQYPEQRLTIANQRMVDPEPLDLERIGRESASMGNRYLSFSELSEDVRPFVKPVDGVTTSGFGRRRILNDQPRNPHSGLDIAADHGTPVAAPAPASVSLTGDFFFNGNTVFLDHGQGLVTMYCHLSEIEVAEGDRVDRGQIIGLVGATGRATGPHLHWSVSLNGYRVDPEQVISVLAVEPAVD